jgi:transcription antitermination protein NusB
MGIRHQARELAMQALFCMDAQKNTSEEMLVRFCDNFCPSEKILPFFLKLVNGVRQAMPEIDTLIERFSKNWKVSRMSCVDRNVIRIAVYEMLYCEDIPPKVSINEAVEVGKKFGSEDSGAFINGIIDSIRIAIEKNDTNSQNSVQPFYPIEQNPK